NPMAMETTTMKTPSPTVLGYRLLLSLAGVAGTIALAGCAQETAPVETTQSPRLTVERGDAASLSATLFVGTEAYRIETGVTTERLPSAQDTDGTLLINGAPVTAASLPSTAQIETTTLETQDGQLLAQGKRDLDTNEFTGEVDSRAFGVD